MNKKGHGISIVIPFRASCKYRRQGKNFRWLKAYWECNLPGAEVIQGIDPCLDRPFSKSVAVNHGVSKSTGDVIVIIDADGYLSVNAVLKCAREIRAARERGRRLWFVPYRKFYRLTDHASRRVIESEPCDPYKFPKPPYRCDIQNTEGSGRGHWFGALCQIVPREAFECVGGWDVRFRGWGGEDHSAMRATDTLYWKHKTLPGAIFHLWHPMLGKKKKHDHEKVGAWIEWNERVWEQQDSSGGNGRLAARYSLANGHQVRMRKLVNEGLEVARRDVPSILRIILRLARWIKGN